MNSPDEKVLVERQSPYHYTQDGQELKELSDRVGVSHAQRKHAG